MLTDNDHSTELKQNKASTRWWAIICIYMKMFFSYRFA